MRERETGTGHGRNPLVWVVVVTHNGAPWIKDCLASLLSTSYNPMRIVVVDNASRDGTAEIVLEEFPSVDLLRRRTNAGYGAACNQGIEAAYGAGAAHVALLNQDIVVTPDWLQPLVSAAEEIPSLGVLSPLQLDYVDDKIDRFVEHILSSMRIEDSDVAQSWADTVVCVRNVIGAAMLLPRRTIERVGGFDPRYFMYGEETDLCERILFHGLYPAVVKSSTVRHYSRRAAEELRGRVRRYYFRNQYVAFLKNPHSTFARNLRSYVRCEFGTITGRLWSQTAGGNLDLLSKLRLATEIGFAQARVAMAIPGLWRTHRLERRGPCHLQLAADADPTAAVSPSPPAPGDDTQRRSSKLRILLGVPHDPFTNIGGAEEHCKNLATWLRASGHEVRVVCVDQNEIFAAGGKRVTLERDGVVVDRLYLPEEHRSEALGWIYKSSFIERAVNDIAQEFQPDLFHLISGYMLTGSASAATCGLGIPTVLTLVDYWFFCPRLHRVRSNGSLCRNSDYGHDCARCLLEERRRFRLAAQCSPRVADAFWRRIGRVPLFGNRFDRRARSCSNRHLFLTNIIRQSEAVISPSMHVLDVAREARISEDKLMHLPHGVPDMFGSNRPAGQRTNTLRLGYFGTISPLKGVHVAVEAVRRFPARSNVELLIYGAVDNWPDYVRRLRRRARGTPWIRFVGQIGHDRVAEAMASVDAVVIPTMCFETFSFVAHEAFATGTPVLCSRNPATETIVTDDVNGLLFERGNPADLHAKVCRLLQEPDLLARLREGIGTVTSLEKELQGIENLYRRVLAKAGTMAGGDRKRLLRC
jgi:GT2 family glycosyltransferase/glycosyltransferase involved in cell wall biosynthesis